jgi:Rap1a immunity proteins
MRATIERLFGPKRALAFVMAITLRALPGCAIEQEEHTQGTSLKTGNDYLRVCGRAFDDDSPADPRTARIDELACFGFTWGVLSGLNATQSAYEGFLRQPKVLCLPIGVNVNQLMRVSLKFLTEHPAELHRSLGELIMVSWIANFPCTSDL